MDILLGVGAGLLGFIFLVVIHELGHFIAAKKTGVKVLEFGIGIPPRLAKIYTDKDGTEYTINWIPLGGFVRLKGEDPSNPDDFHASDSFISAGLLQKVIILIAGVVINLLFGWIMITGLFWIGTKPLFIIPDNATTTQARSYILPTISFLRTEGLIPQWSGAEDGVLVLDTMSGGLAQKIGLTSGDRIWKINDIPIGFSTIHKTLAGLIGSGLEVMYERSGQMLSGRTECPVDNCLLGVSMESPDFGPVMIQFPLGRAMVEAGKEIGTQWTMTTQLLGRIFYNLATFNRAAVAEDGKKLSGPVGMMKIFTIIVSGGDIPQYFSFLAIISLALGIFNILPIPALDGGRLVGVLIQSIGRFKKESYFSIEGYINTVVFLLLFGLGIWIMVRDLNILWGVSLW